MGPQKTRYKNVRRIDAEGSERKTATQRIERIRMRIADNEGVMEQAVVKHRVA